MCLSTLKAEGGYSALKLRDKESFEMLRVESLSDDFIESPDLNSTENF